MTGGLEGQDRSFLSADDCRALFRRIVGMTTGGGQTQVSLRSRRTGTATWVRNRAALAADTQSLDLSIRRTLRNTRGEATTTRLDDAGLHEAVEAAERTRLFFERRPREILDPFVDEPILQPTLWSEPTFALTAAARIDIVRRMIEPVEAAGLFAAGAITIAGQGQAAMGTDGTFRYYPVTAVECSITVRNAAGTASGWAGVTHHDLSRIDPEAITARALDKCQRSEKPTAVEPGRYTVILEPQAVHDLFAPVIEGQMDRALAEAGWTTFAGGSEGSLSKIGSRVLDSRLTLSADPMDPGGGFLPFDERGGTPYRPVTWIERGVLKELAYDRTYAARVLGEQRALLNSGSFHLQGAAGVPMTPIDQMIALTDRGLLVTRLSNVGVLDTNSVLCAGFTRDGIWLIERGKIAMPVKNFRFTDSPMFALNNLEAVGPTARVFSPDRARIAPAVKVRDFNFTSLADAI